ncbi:MAG TPA: carboxypeptidase-like regulatory domain-containing protein, partial [Candidatus Obscuribacterales bacterium]
MKTTKKSRAQSLMITGVMSLGLALVGSCAPAGPTQTKPSTSPTPSATATASPTPQSPPQSTPQPTATPTATVTAIPTPVSTSDLIIAERTTFNGKIYDDSHFPLEDVTITAKSLNSAIPYSETTMTRNGNYTFNAAPSGVELAITASKPGFTTRRR